MISKNLSNKMSSNEFIKIAHYFGIAVQSEFSDIALKKLSDRDEKVQTFVFMDIELFFLTATLQLNTSRLAEGILCWLLTFGHLLSPSKTRRLILSGNYFNPAILGGFIEFMIEKNIMTTQWKIIRPFCKKKLHPESLLNGPLPRLPSSYFLRYQIIAPQFRLDTNKFLLPKKNIYKNCVELKNRALFGSVVNADVASYLLKNPNSTPYQIAVNTHHHKARVFEVYKDVLDAS